MRRLQAAHIDFLGSLKLILNKNEKKKKKRKENDTDFFFFFFLTQLIGVGG